MRLANGSIIRRNSIRKVSYHEMFLSAAKRGSYLGWRVLDGSLMILMPLRRSIPVQ